MCLSAAPTFFFRGSAFNDACADTAPVLSVTNFFGYNPRSEVTEAVMGDETYGYAYDPTGSRIVTTESTETTEHLANALTPYTNILCVPASLRLTREADGNPTLHDASCNGGPARLLEWDAENRLVAVMPVTGEWTCGIVCPQDGDLRTFNAYNPLHRRIRMTEEIYYEGATFKAQRSSYGRARRAAAPRMIVRAEPVLSVQLINARNMVRLAGVEPTTFGFGGQHSIQLSYRRKKVGVY